MMIELKVNKGKLQEVYLKAITQGTLNNKEYEVLVACCAYKEVDTAAKREIQGLLNISQYSFNNYMAKLKKLGYAIKSKHTYTIPEIFIVDEDSATIRFKEKSDE